MPLGTIGDQPRPFFRQGLPAPLRLLLCTLLSVLLMLGDARWGITQPLRTVLSVLIYPVQWLALAPIEWAHRGADLFQSRESVRREAQRAREQLLNQSVKSLQVEQLQLENQRLRALLDMRERGGLDARCRVLAAPLRLVLCLGAWLVSASNRV